MSWTRGKNKTPDEELLELQNFWTDVFVGLADYLQHEKGKAFDHPDVQFVHKMALEFADACASCRGSLATGIAPWSSFGRADKILLDMRIRFGPLEDFRHYEHPRTRGRGAAEIRD